MVRVGIIGLGYWGPGLLRNFTSLEDAEVTVVCDLSKSRLEAACAQYPNVFATTQTDDVLKGDMVDAVVIATPTKTHYPLAKQALQQGLHTFVEKPLATTSAECRDLMQLASNKDVVLFVGHVFLYTAAVTKLKQLVQLGELGKVGYISATRLNLGPVRQDVNALWDLAPHDISIILELMGKAPTSVNCQGVACLSENLQDVCTVAFNYDGQRMAMLHASWLYPDKKRLITVVGDKKMAIYDDMEPFEKIKVYDRGVDAQLAYEGSVGLGLSYRYGDTYSPGLEQVEPLKTECMHFIECVREGKTPKTDGRNGLEVVRVLEAAEASLQQGGTNVKLQGHGTGRGNGSRKVSSFAAARQ